MVHKKMANNENPNFLKGGFQYNSTLTIINTILIQCTRMYSTDLSLLHRAQINKSLGCAFQISFKDHHGYTESASF